MRKLLLSRMMLLLCALVAGSGSVWAEDEPELTLDLSSSWGTGSTSNGITSFTTTISETSYTISGAGGANFKFSSTYFIFGKTGAYINLPKVDFDVEKIVVIGNGGGSASVKMNIYVGETAVSTETTGCGTGSSGGTASTLTYDIATASQAANTQYTLKVTSNHNAQITKIHYYKKESGGGDASTVATPSFSPVGGTYTSAQNVTISCDTEDATIHYTTSGDEPTESDATYSSAISITTSGTVLKAKAFKEGMTASSIASATYTIKPTTPNIAAEGPAVTITGDDGCTFYYTTDGSAPTSSSTEYTGSFDLDESCTIKAIAYDAYGNASDVKTYTFKYFPLSPKNINSGYFEKVTDASTLENGDAILIVNEDASVAMSTTQNNNNRGQATVSISNDVIYAPAADVQKLVLVKQTEKIDDIDTDVFYFYTGSKYLYAGSNSSNHLKSEDTPDNNGNARATITISEGNATITFTGINSHNLIQYNSGNSLFSCYGSAQAAVQIYKEVAHNVPATITNAEYATFNSQFALDFSTTGITAYTATDGETKVTLNEITSGKVPANTPVVLYKAGADGTPINVPVTASADAVEGTNDLHVSTGTDVTNMYVLSKQNGKVGFYLWNGSSDLSAGKIYLQGKASYGAARSFIGFDDVTAVKSMKALPAAQGAYYNLNGQQVTQPAKGLYIVNGKKVIK